MAVFPFAVAKLDSRFEESTGPKRQTSRNPTKWCFQRRAVFEALNRQRSPTGQLRYQTMASRFKFSTLPPFLILEEIRQEFTSTIHRNWVDCKSAGAPLSFRNCGLFSIVRGCHRWRLGVVRADHSDHRMLQLRFVKGFNNSTLVRRYLTQGRKRTFGNAFRLIYLQIL